LSLLSKILRKIRMCQMINSNLWEVPASIRWACQLKKFLPGLTPLMHKDRMNKIPVKRSPFYPDRERETSKNLSHFKGKRQNKFKRKIKNLLPR
jgi:hypothetical protein